GMDFAAPLRPIVLALTLSRVVAEDADIACAEDLAQFDGPPEAFQLRLERIADLDLADRRADGAELEAVLVQQRLELLDLQVVQVQHVGLVDRAELDVLDAALLEYVDLLLGAGIDLVGKRGEREHAEPRVLNAMDLLREMLTSSFGGDNGQLRFV